jgi:hypothetical protein
VDDQERWSGATDFDVQGRTVDVASADESWHSPWQRVRVRAGIGQGHTDQRTGAGYHWHIRGASAGHHGPPTQTNGPMPA